MVRPPRLRVRRSPATRRAGEPEELPGLPSPEPGAGYEKQKFVLAMHPDRIVVEEVRVRTGASE